MAALPTGWGDRPNGFSEAELQGGAEVAARFYSKQEGGPTNDESLARFYLSQAEEQQHTNLPVGWNESKYRREVSEMPKTEKPSNSSLFAPNTAPQLAAAGVFAGSADPFGGRRHEAPPAPDPLGGGRHEAQPAASPFGASRHEAPAQPAGPATFGSVFGGGSAGGPAPTAGLRAGGPGGAAPVPWWASAALKQPAAAPADQGAASLRSATQTLDQLVTALEAGQATGASMNIPAADREAFRQAVSRALFQINKMDVATGVGEMEI